jgi:hypothetical protein
MLNERLEKMSQILSELYNIAQEKFPSRQIDRIRKLVREYVDNMPIENLIQLLSMGIKKLDIYWYIALRIFRKYSIAIKTSYDRELKRVDAPKYRVFEEYLLPKEPLIRKYEYLIFPTIDPKGLLLNALKPQVLKGDKEAIKMYTELIKTLPKEERPSLIKPRRFRKKKLDDGGLIKVEIEEVKQSPTDTITIDGKDLLDGAEIIDG